MSIQYLFASTDLDTYFAYFGAFVGLHVRKEEENKVSKNSCTAHVNGYNFYFYFPYTCFITSLHCTSYCIPRCLVLELQLNSFPQNLSISFLVRNFSISQLTQLMHSNIYFIESRIVFCACLVRAQVSVAHEDSSSTS